MPRKSSNKPSSKKKLGLMELSELVDLHEASPVYVENADGEPALEPWLKDLRFQQAFWVARELLNGEIDETEFNQRWQKTTEIEQTEEPSDTVEPNTATFGGFRHRRRSALNRGQANSSPKKNKKRW